MNRNQTGFIRLISELYNDMVILGELSEKLKRNVNKLNSMEPDEFDLAGLAYAMQNIYNAFENYMLRIAKFFENDLSNDSWHKELVERMTLEIKDFRPALFNRDFAAQIGELRSFRHFFRNSYFARLDKNKIFRLADKIPGILNEFSDIHRNYIGELDQIKSYLTE